MKKPRLITLLLSSSQNVFPQGRDSLSYFDPHVYNFDPHETVQYIRPPYLDEYLNNPHKGTTTFQRLAGEELYPGLRWDDGTAPLTFDQAPTELKNVDHYPPTTIAYIRWKWADLEPEKGKIRFEIVENALKAASERGQTLQVRFQPFTGGDTPSWYWDTGAGVDEAFKDWYGYATPDHNDPLYLRHWGAFIKAMGARFDGHPNLESVDLAYGGDWGEMGGNASYETARKLVDIYYEAFSSTTLILMTGSPGSEYASEQTKRAVGWRADCFGDFSKHGWRKRDTTENNWNHMYVAYPSLFELDGLKEKWKAAPVVLETCGTVSSWYKAGYDIDKILETGLRFHVSVFMPKSVKIPGEWMGKIMAFNKKMGYRFYIHNMTMPKAVAAGEEIRISTTIDNEGVAPIYKKYTFSFKLAQGNREYIYHSDQDITTWMPFYTHFTDVVKVPDTFQKGAVKVSCAIVDSNDKPVVKFAIRDIDSQGWHPLASIIID